MKIPYPPGYEPTLGKRSADEILAELNRRCGFANGPVRTLDPSEALPPPALRMEPKISLDIHVPRGAKRRGLESACGRNAKARKKAAK
jgi:hypothetical protein